MNNLIQRTLTGIIFVAVLMGSIISGSAPFAGVFSLIVIFTTREFYLLMKQKDYEPQVLGGVVASVVLFLSTYQVLSGHSHKVLLSVNILSIFSIFIFELFRNKKQPLKNILVTIGGVIYVGLPFALLNLIAFLPIDSVIGNYNKYILLGFFIILWANDTGAYVVGSLIGKNRLFERISPKKSWEGSIGGAFFAVGFAVLMYYFTGLETAIFWVIFALSIVVFGTLGDLVESLLKRDLGVKDSGSILPGHGGFLDRFDAVLMAAPFASLSLIIVKIFL
ncbi:MAG: phosphatidate cytidylyltransferase [Bacteroidales bacterium]|nr:phosphatidate cytidylyltransferase [Bacteroidales bacterium]